MYYIGVDLAWTQSGITGICILNNNGNVEFLKAEKFKDKELLDIVRKYEREESLIGIDAPLILNNESGSRRAERLLFYQKINGYRIRAFSVSRNFLLKKYKTIRGEGLYKALLKEGLRLTKSAKKGSFGILEVFPRGIIGGLFPEIFYVNYKVKRGIDLPKAREGIESILEFLSSRTYIRSLNSYIKLDGVEGFDRRRIKEVGDMLDACLISYGLFMVNKGFSDEVIYGDLKDGFVWIPLRRRDEKD